MGCCYSRDKKAAENKEGPREPSVTLGQNNSMENPRTPIYDNLGGNVIPYTLTRPPNKRKPETKLRNSTTVDDDDYFKYDSELYKSRPINSVPEEGPKNYQNINMNELTLNSNREGPLRIGGSLAENSIIMPEYIDDFDDVHDILDITKDTKILNDTSINNDIEDLKNNYVSFSSNRITSQYVTPRDDTKSSMMDVNGFSSKKYDFFYLEFHYFLLWNKDYLKGIYPELNFMVLIEINDDKSSLEKILLQKSGDERYFPQRPQNSTENFIRIMRVLNKEATPYDNGSDSVHKLKLSVINNTCGKFLPVCVEEVFISENKSYEGVKIKFNQNMNMVQSTKKIGCIQFNFAYRSEELNKSQIFDQSDKMFKLFCQIDKTIKYQEEPLLVYKYNFVPNYYIKQNGSESENKMKNNFSSILDVQDTDFGGELQNEGISLNRLLELFDVSKHAYDFYVILKKVGDFMNMSEFNEEKSLKFKEKILIKIKELLEIKNTDKFLISMIFVTLKKLFFKTKKDNNRSKSPRSSTTPKNEAEMKQKLMETAKIQEINLGLMRNFLELSFDYLVEKSFPEEISIAALNYIFKHYEEIIQNFFLEGKRKLTSDEFFSNYILNKRRYEVLIDLLVRYPENPSCVQTILHIANKTIKFRREESKVMIDYVLKSVPYEVLISKILKAHDCNSFIMTNLMYFLYYIVDIYKNDIEKVFSSIGFGKMRELFCTFRANGFEQIHETLLYILKNILTKKFERQPNQDEAITDDEFKDVIIILSTSLELIRLKITICKDFFRQLAPLLINLLNYVYIICSLINGFNSRRKKICMERKVSELVIDVLASINERKLFFTIDTAFNRHDIISLNTKTMVFRALFHCIQLIRGMKEAFPSTLTKPYAEKIYKVIKAIGDYDNVYNPDSIARDIQRVYNNMDNRTVTVALDTLRDYYQRYKKQEHEYVGEFLTILRSS